MKLVNELDRRMEKPFSFALSMMKWTAVIGIPIAIILDNPKVMLAAIPVALFLSIRERL